MIWVARVAGPVARPRRQGCTYQMEALGTMRDRGDKPTSEDARLFAEAMRQLGLKDDDTMDAEDAALFEAAVAAGEFAIPDDGGTDEEAVTDHGPEDRGTDRALRRKIRQDKVQADATLDLHGLRREDAQRKLSRFLTRQRRDGARVVKVICGRGLHSRQHAVLQELVPQWLDGALAHHTRQWVRAPRAKGGAGALYVFLRTNHAP